MKTIKIKTKLIENGKLPVYKRDGDVCLDCYSRVGVTIERGRRALVPLGFAMELPKGWEATVRPRSGNTNDAIDIAEGTIDSNYRGEVKACVINSTQGDIFVGPGDRICQLAVREAPTVIWEVVEELSETVRGDKGFGSSGIK